VGGCDAFDEWAGQGRERARGGWEAMLSDAGGEGRRGGGLGVAMPSTAGRRLHGVHAAAASSRSRLVERHRSSRARRGRRLKSSTRSRARSSARSKSSRACSGDGRACAELAHPVLRARPRRLSAGSMQLGHGGPGGLGRVRGGEPEPDLLGAGHGLPCRRRRRLRARAGEVRGAGEGGRASAGRAGGWVLGRVDGWALGRAGGWVLGWVFVGGRAEQSRKHRCCGQSRIPSIKFAAAVAGRRRGEGGPWAARPPHGR
jgi:hypothetical protein